MVAFDVTSLVPASVWNEGPTPGALQEMLDSIDKHTEQVRSDLFYNMMSSLAGSADPSVLKAMASLDGISSSSGTEQWVAQHANKYMEMQEHVAKLQAELKAAQAAADLEATLKEFKGFLDNGQFNDAAYHLVQLRKILEDTSSSSSSDNGGYSKGSMPLASAELMQLQEACTHCTRDLEEALESSLAEAFDCALDHGVITITSALPGGGDVGDLWGAMELAGSAERHLAAIADKLLQQVLPHVLNGTALLHCQLSGESEARIQWYAAQPQPDGSFSTEHVEQACMQLLALLAQALFRQRPSTLREFGGCFWGGFVGQYQAAFLQQVQGSSVALLQARQEAARQMEQQAVAVGLAEPGSDLASCLSRAIQQSYHVVQEQYLAEARELLASHDRLAPPVVVGQPLPLDAGFYQRYKEGKVKAWEVLDPPSGWDVSGPVLATGYYHVSATVLQQVMMIDDALAHACHQGDISMAQAIVGAVSKMSAMFSSMLPAPAAADAPSLALLRHNDLQYLAGHLLVLPFLFGPELKALLGSYVWLGNDALRLRGAARAAFNDVVSGQQASIRQELQPLLQWSAALAAGKPMPPKEAEAAAAARDKATPATLYTLRRAGKDLWGTLAPGVALEASQQLLDTLAGLLVGDVLKKQDIGESEAYELVQLYRPLAEKAVQELLGDVDLSSQGSLEGLDLRDLVAGALRHRCGVLRKLDAVLGLLAARLAAIVDAWERGQLAAAGLSLVEVRRLVVALFEDTDYRAQCLQRMECCE
ncbi:hypothetical protein OEZ85_008594 [Tetradesmus obliquus]|uniref:ZW10 C-terminal helical domain-containing protein n=1 Tax=Tetradesmus obliquus TaxID=3088 RepID=A0ABY8TNY1_TETOB|nr:hypothetical protein OEZ85_008594 [Tetradesmus obliquus]